jgi:hypothetical protein
MIAGMKTFQFPVPTAYSTAEDSDTPGRRPSLIKSIADCQYPGGSWDASGGGSGAGAIFHQRGDDGALPIVEDAGDLVMD